MTAIVDPNGEIQTFDYSVDLLKAILWQYNDAANLQALLTAKSEWYATNQEAFWSSWYDDVFNVDTATDFGLGVWAKILGISFSTSEGSDEAGKPIWGFNSNAQNFGRANFTRTSGSSVTLTAEQKRLVIKMRYLKLISRGSIPDINKALKTLFSASGDAYAVSNGGMVLAYTFKFKPTSGQRYILENFDLLPRPAAVGYEMRFLPVSPFGFGSTNNNFDNGTFYK